MRERTSPTENTTEPEADKQTVKEYLQQRIKDAVNYFTINGRIIYGKNLAHAEKRYNKHFHQ